MPSPAAFLAVGIVTGLPDVAPTRDLSAVRSEQIGAVGRFLILFQGGLATGLRAARAVVRPIVAVGLLGTAATAGGAAFVARFGLGLEWSIALLVGVGRALTDPAAVYAVLRGRGWFAPRVHYLRGRVRGERPDRDRLDGCGRRRRSSAAATRSMRMQRFDSDRRASSAEMCGNGRFRAAEGLRQLRRRDRGAALGAFQSSPARASAVGGDTPTAAVSELECDVIARRRRESAG